MFWEVCFGVSLSIKQRLYYYFFKARIQIRGESKYEVYDEVKDFILFVHVCTHVYHMYFVFTIIEYCFVFISSAVVKNFEIVDSILVP